MLDRLPYELLENIVYWLANEDDAAGSHCCSAWSSALPAVFLLNHKVHDLLLGATTLGESPSHALFVRLFRTHFDKTAFERRFGVQLSSAEVALEYKKRMGVLRRIGLFNRFLSHSDDQSEDQLYEDIWAVFLMLYEDDGNNMRQLQHFGLEAWATHLTHEYAFHSLNRPDWPVDTYVPRLLFAILSMVNTIESVKHEDVHMRGRLINVLQYFIIAPHLYPISHHPIQNFFAHENNDPNSQEGNTDATVSIRSPEAVEVEHFGHILILTPPSVVESAVVLLNLRQERNPVPILPGTPETRADAMAQGRTGATKEDYRENDYHRMQALGSETPHAGSEREAENLARLPSPLRGSERYDMDMWRLVSVDWTRKNMPETTMGFWIQTVYRVGTLTGKWFGRLQAPFFEDFLHMRSIHPARPEWVDMVAQPMQFNVREHITTSPEQSLSVSSEQNAWYPNGVDPSRHENPTGFAVVDPRDWRTKHYQLYNAGMELPRGNTPEPPQRLGDYLNELSPSWSPMDVEMAFEEEFARTTDMDADPDGELGSQFLDLCITGETGTRYGFAWGDFSLYGRVRKNDGLIVFVRTHPNPDVGRWIFSGYLRASTTVVGQWRVSGEDVNTLAYSGTFMLTKVGEEWGPPPGWTWPSSSSSSS